MVKPETTDDALSDAAQCREGLRKRAEVQGFYVGGKTGTSEKVIGGRYSKTKLLTSFTAILPADKPRYLVLIMLDEPQALPETQGYATSGWNAAPVAGNVIAKIAPMLGLEPRFDLPRGRATDPGARAR